MRRHPGSDCTDPSSGLQGYISDVGGPAATFRRPSCQSSSSMGCAKPGLSGPEPCPNLDADHTDYMMLLREAAGHPRVKKVFIRSGIPSTS